MLVKRLQILIIAFEVFRKRGVWGAAAPQPPEAEKAGGLGGGSHPQPPEAEKGRGLGAAATPAAGGRK